MPTRQGWGLWTPLGGFVRYVLVLTIFIIALTGCPSEPPALEPRFPGKLVFELLDKEVETSSELLLGRYPNASRVAGSFRRYQVPDSEVLDEIVMFRNVRSGRVDSVILKYRADLTARDRQAVFDQAGHPEMADAIEVREVEWDRGLTFRVTPADRFGRLTLTVEP